MFSALSCWHAKCSHYSMSKIIIRTPMSLLNDFSSDWDRAFFNEDYSFWRRNISSSVQRRDTEDGYNFHIPLAGFKKENVKCELKDGLVSVSAKQKEDSASYSFFLPEDFDESSVSSKLEDGLLTVSVKRREEPKGVDIKIG